MTLKEWFKAQFTLKALNKKVFLFSKLIALLVILLYLISSTYLMESALNTVVIISVVVLLIMSLDLLLYKMIVTPISYLERIAEKMSRLDFSEYCDLKTNDEFEKLGDSLNIMADNLQKSLVQLSNTNEKLAHEIDKKEVLLEQRKELVDQLAHEMKTPLGVIKSYSEGAKDSVNEYQRRKYLETIIVAIDEMNDLIVSLLDLSALESESIQFKQEKFDFIELVETLLGQLLLDVPEKTYKVNCILPEHKICVNFDKARMKQVISNLITNAKKYVSYMGTISVEVHLEDNFLKFVVFNTGSLIPPSCGDQIWEKFFKTNRNDKKSGSGLGLAIVAHILKIENIRYGYLNRQDGVEFYFYIPLRLIEHC